MEKSFRKGLWAELM